MRTILNSAGSEDNNVNGLLVPQSYGNWFELRAIVV